MARSDASPSDLSASQNEGIRRDLENSFPNLFGGPRGSQTSTPSLTSPFRVQSQPASVIHSWHSAEHPNVTQAVDRFRQSVHLPAVSTLLNRATPSSGCTVPVSVTPPMTVSTVQNRYNPYRSYVPIHCRRRRSATSTTAGRKFTKTIVLVSFDENEVPRGNRRQELHSAGAIVDLVDFTQIGVKPRFQFLKAVSKWLLHPNVPPNHEWTGEKIQQLAKHGDIYIKPTYSIQEQVCSEVCETLPQIQQQPLPSSLPTIPPLRPPLPPTSSTIVEAPQTPGNEQDNYPSHVSLNLPGSSGLQSGTLRCGGVDLSIGDQSSISGPSRVNAAETGPSSPSHSSDDDYPIQRIPMPFLLDPEVEVAEADVSFLSEMFQNTDEQQLRHYRITLGLSLEKVVNLLLARGNSESSQSSSKSVLSALSSRLIDFDRDITIAVNRSCIWQKAQVWYKVALADPSRLKKNLTVEFSGEVGLDAGALRNEFFTALLQDLNTHFFEGPDYRRVPKNEWELEKGLEMAGMMIAHSLLLGGPSFACLHPAMYEWMVDPSKELVEDLPTVDDIPRIAANIDLIDLVTKIDASTSQSEIEEIIDDPRYLSIVNSSGWPTNRCITLQSRSAFLHGLIVGEFSKRVNLMKYFARGLDKLKVFDAVKQNPVQMRHVFVYNEDEVLTSEKFVKCLRTKRPTDEEKGKVYDWFLEYVHRKGAEGCETLTSPSSAVSLADVLSFVSGLKAIPPLGLKENGGIVVTFLRKLPTKVYPIADACFNTIKLPVCHQDKATFFAKMDEGIGNSLNYFG